MSHRTRISIFTLKKFGLKTDFGKELLPADYESITLHATDTLDFYLAHLVGSSELYTYSEEKRDIYDEVGRRPFTEIKQMKFDMNNIPND